MRNSRDIGRAWIVGFWMRPASSLESINYFPSAYPETFSSPPVSPLPFPSHPASLVSILLMCNLQSYSIAA